MIDIVVGLAAAAVLIAVTLWGQQRWRRRLERAMTGPRQVELSVLGASAAGSFGPAVQRIGIAYPFEGGRDTLGLVVANGRLELWGFVSRTPRRLSILPAEVRVRHDAEHAIPVIWMEWNDPEGRCVLRFIPIRMLWVVRVAAHRTDISSIAHRIRQTVTQPRP